MIDELLEEYNLTRYQVAKASGIPEATLKKAQDKPLNNMTVKTLQALAMATGLTPGEILNKLLKINGNSIIQFIEAHPYLNKELVTEIENLMIEISQSNIDLTQVTFNRYYDAVENNEIKDTNQNAEIAIQNLIKVIKEKF